MPEISKKKENELKKLSEERENEQIVNACVALL